jgi:hypothetical protein
MRFENKTCQKLTLGAKTTAWSHKGEIRSQKVRE